tara:strand:+ start:370 stop:1725 length:1356 start_codon:yes stop_codon:yes gene_type:complete
MSNSSFYGYSYFSGANCFVKINGIPALEMAGISYQVQESTQPIYGYSSRIFDAVAIGQKMVRGNFVINFIAPNYIARIIDVSRASINLQELENQYTKYSGEDINNLISSSEMTKKIAETENRIKLLEAQYELMEAKRAAEEENLQSVQRAANDLLEGGNYSGLYDDQNALNSEYEQNMKALEENFQNKIESLQEEYDTFTPSNADLFDNDATGTSAYRRWLTEKGMQDNFQSLGQFSREAKPIIFRKYVDKLSSTYNTERASMEAAYLERFKELQEKIDYYQEAERIATDLQEGGDYDSLRSDYDEVRGNDESEIETYKKKLEEYKVKLETENKTLVEKQVQSRQDFEKLIKDLKKAKNFKSKKQAEAALKAFEKASNKYYVSEDQRNTVGLTNINDIGLLGPFNIDIQFAEEYTITIVDAFLTSRGSMIQIDENAIVEEYSFFARDIKYT